MSNYSVDRKNILLYAIAILLMAYFFAILIINSYTYSAIAALVIVLVILAAKFPFLFLMILFIINEKGFKTIDFGIEHWQYTDIALLALGLGIIVQFFRNALKLKELFSQISQNIYFKYILLILILVHLSTYIGGHLISGQPLNTLLFKAREFYLYLVFLYLFMADFDLRQIKKFLTLALFTTFCVSILVVIDAKLLGSGSIFQLAMTDGISGLRLHSVRISVNHFMAAWVYFYLLSSIRFKQSGFKKIFYIIFAVIILYQLIFIGMGRQVMIQILLTTILFISTTKSNIKLTLICAIFAMCILTATFFLNYTDVLQNNFVYRLIVKTLYEASITHGSSIAIRMDGIKYFFPYFMRSPFLGIGLLSSTYKNSPVTVGLQMGYNFADFGIFSTLFRFGLLSILLTILMVKSIFSDLKSSYPISSEGTRIIISSIIYLFIYLIILVPSATVFFYGSSCLYFGILLYFVYRIKQNTV